MSLTEFLVWVLSGGGSGVISYWLMENLSFLANLLPKWKRAASLALAAIVAMLGYLLAVGMAYTPQPETIKVWIEALFSVVAVAIGLGQLIHGYKKL